MCAQFIANGDKCMRRHPYGLHISLTTCQLVSSVAIALKQSVN